MKGIKDVKYIVIKEDLTLVGRHTIQYTDDIELYFWSLYNYINQCHPIFFNMVNLVILIFPET